MNGVRIGEVFRRIAASEMALCFHMSNQVHHGFLAWCRLAIDALEPITVSMNVIQYDCYSQYDC